MGGIHGDEPGSVISIKLLEKFLKNTKNIDGTVKTIICNERAVEKNQRYIDNDLNRLFGSRSSDGHEGDLAEKILKIVSDLDFVLSFHSSKSVPPAFCISNTFNDMKSDILSLPVDYAVLDNSNDSLETEIDNVLNIELGRQHTNQVITNGLISSKSVLSNRGLIEFKHNFTETDIIESKRKMKKLGKNPKVYYRNFECVDKGDIIAEDSKICHVSQSNSVVPYLISQYGYENIFGYLGEYKYTISKDI